jgi:hypothetical protein
VPLDVRGDHGLRSIMKFCRQCALIDQNLAERPGLLHCPLCHRGDELVTIDQIHLKRKEAKEHVMIEA